MNSDILVRNIDEALGVDSFGTDEENAVEAIFEEVDEEISSEEAPEAEETPTQSVVRKSYPAAVVDKVISSNQYQIENEDVLTDYRLVRSNFHKMIMDGLDASEELKHIAKDSGHPKTFEAFQKMLATTAEMSNDLLNVHKKMKHIENDTFKKTKDGGSSVNVNNAVFVGTLDDLLKGIGKAETDLKDD